MLTLKDKVCGMFLGIGIGDAFGSPFESKNYEYMQSIEKSKDYSSSSRAEKGMTSDDTQLTISVANAMMETGSIDMDAIAAHHVKAYKETTSGWGRTSRDAIKKISEGVSWRESGKFDIPNHGLGNGVPMKIGPIAAYYAITKRLSNYEETLFNFTAMTHRTSVAVSSAFAHTKALYECLLNDTKELQVKSLIKKIVNASAVGRNYFPETLNEDDITKRLETLLEVYEYPDLLYNDDYLVSKYGGGTCYVYNSLPFSYAFFLRSPFSLKGMFDVSYAGGDTDTNASFVASMVGALVGPSVFPTNLIDGLVQKDEILKLAEDFYEDLRQKAPTS